MTHVALRPQFRVLLPRTLPPPDHIKGMGHFFFFPNSFWQEKLAPDSFIFQIKAISVFIIRVRRNGLEFFKLLSSAIHKEHSSRS